MNLPSSGRYVYAIPDENDSDIDKKLRSIRAKRRNKRIYNRRKKINANLRKRKIIPEEVSIGEAGVDRDFEDIGINKKDSYVGRLEGDESILKA